MKKMKLIAKLLIFLGLIAIAIQDIAGKKSCDCSKCKQTDTRINLIVGQKLQDGGGKSSCSMCDERKEMLRMERERQQQLQKCPFEILGSPAINGKTSEEIFDEFRYLIAPSQNGFFDLMRGIVKTMHVSSEAELKWAQEKEQKEKIGESGKQEEAEKEASKDDTKVMLILNQEPCEKFIGPNVKEEITKKPMHKRFVKEANSKGLR